MAVVINGTTGITTPDIDVEGSILSIDSANNRVGINTDTPSTRLEVLSDNNARENLAKFKHSGQQDFIIQGQWGSQDIGGSNGTLLYSTGTLGFRTGSSGIANLVIDAVDNNVGIGTDNPDQNSTLHVYNGSGNVKLTLETTEDYDSYINFSGYTAEASIGYEATSNSLIFSNAADGITTAERLRISDAGRIGVGTDTPNPNCLMDINGILRIYNSSTYNSESTGSLYLVSARSSATNGLILGTDNANSIPYIQPLHPGVTYARNLAICPVGGNVGISTINPSAKLTLVSSSGDVASGIRLSDGTSDRGNIYYNGGQILIIHGASDPGGADQSTLQLATGSTPTARLSITRDGLVGINTTAPTSNLSVQGVITYGNYSGSFGSLSYGSNFVTLEASSTNTDIFITPSGKGLLKMGSYDGVYLYTRSGGVAGTSTLTFDFNWYAGGGNSLYVLLWGSHWTGGYQCIRRAFVVGDSYNNFTTFDDFNSGSAAMGSWDFSRPSNATFRITKTAGTYGQFMNYQIMVYTQGTARYFSEP